MYMTLGILKLAENQAILSLIASLIALVYILFSSNFDSSWASRGIRVAVWLAVVYPLQRSIAAGNQSFPLADEKLNGQTAIVTGANTGIGYEAALELVHLGCEKVVIACRTESKAMKAIAEAQQHAISVRGWSNWTDAHTARLKFIPLDVADDASIEKFVKLVDAEFPKGFDILVNNAGIFTKQRGLTKSGHELVVGTNSLGPFLLTELLLNKVHKRIVMVSSVAHTWIPFLQDKPEQLKRYLDCLTRRMRVKENAFDESRPRNAGIATRTKDLSEAEVRKYGVPGYAYGTSKLLNLLYASELARRPDVIKRNVIVSSLHPGGVITNIFDELPMMVFFMRHFLKMIMKFPVEGARTIVSCAAATNIKSGAYHADCKPTPDAATPMALSTEAQDMATRWCREQWENRV